MLTSAQQLTPLKVAECAMVLEILQLGREEKAQCVLLEGTSLICGLTAYGQPPHMVATLSFWPSNFIYSIKRRG